jgi:hypothetical protein
MIIPPANSEMQHFIFESKQLGSVIDTSFLNDPDQALLSDVVIAQPPDGWSKGVTSASYSVQQYPERALVSNPIPTELIEQYSNQNAQAFAGIVNASHTRQTANAPGTSFNNSRYLDVDACDNFEGRLVQTLSAMERPMGSFYDSLRRKIGWTIITNGVRPVAVEKYVGTPLILGLEALNAGGVNYPAGSVYRAKIPNFKHRAPQRGEKKVIASSDVSELSFKRLSLFATSPELRPKEYPRIREHTELVISRWSMDYIKEIVQNAYLLAS